MIVGNRFLSKAVAVFSGNGKMLASQVSNAVLDKDGFLDRVKIIFIAESVPSIGYSTYYLRPATQEAAEQKPAAATEFENAFYKLSFGNGGIEKLIDKASGKSIFSNDALKAGDVFTLKSVGNGAGEFCSSSGYGADGPYVNRPGQDLLAQSLSGAPFLNGKKGDMPVVTAVGQADLLTSLFIVQSVLAAIYYRQQTGKGQKIEACLYNSIIAFHTQEITAFLYKGETPERSESGIPNPWLGAPYGMYKTKDNYISIGMSSVRKLAVLLNIAEYDDAKYDSNNIIECRDEIRMTFEKVFMTKTTSEWLDILLPHDIWCSQVNSFKEMVADPQVQHNKMIIDCEHPVVGNVRTPGFPVKFSETPQTVYRPSPLLGEHTEEILKELTKGN